MINKFDELVDVFDETYTVAIRAFAVFALEEVLGEEEAFLLLNTLGYEDVCDDIADNFFAHNASVDNRMGWLIAVYDYLLPHTELVASCRKLALDMKALANQNLDVMEEIEHV